MPWREEGRGRAEGLPGSLGLRRVFAGLRGAGCGGCRGLQVLALATSPFTTGRPSPLEQAREEKQRSRRSA